MSSITNNEMLFVLSIFKSPEIRYNSNSIAKHLNISSMGALKIARKLEKERILISKELGKAKFFELNIESNYSKKYIQFLLNWEAEHALPYVKRWISEIKKLKSADSAVLFGSVLKKEKNANDIDVLLITDKKRFLKLKREIEEINLTNNKKLHPIFQTKNDFKRNLKKQDAPLLDAIKGIFVFGEDIIINLFIETQK